MVAQTTDPHSPPPSHSAQSSSRTTSPRPSHTSSPSRWSLLRVVIPGLILWFDAVLVQSSADTPGMVAPALAIAGSIGLFFHLPMLARPLWFRLSIGTLGVFFLVRLVQFPPEAVETGFIVVPRTYTVALAEFSLSCQALLLWRWRSQDPLPIAFFCVAIATSVFALNKTLPLGTQGVYVVLVTVSLLLPILLSTSQSISSATHQCSLPWNARLMLVLVGGAVLVGTWAATEAWSRWLPDAQSWFAAKVRNIASDNLRLRHYATTGSLSAIREEQTIDPDGAALRVYCNDRPGYLAGRIFDQYEAGSWHIAVDTIPRQPQRKMPGTRILKPLDPIPNGIKRSTNADFAFEINRFGTSGTLRRMSIENDPRRGSVYFTPLECRYVLGRGDSIAVDNHDIIRAGLSVRAPYVAFADTTNSTRPLSNRQLRQLSTPLPGLDQRITDLADRVCRHAPTTGAKIRAIRDYFHNNYKYSLDPVEVPRRTDPLVHFLIAKHPAHCEFFASGAVALLRLQGIPARYATGYCVMQLEDENEHYWIARNQDAHAWAEAFDRQQQKWIIVEATPGFLDPNLDDTLGDDESGSGAQGSSLAFTSENASAIAQWWHDLPPHVKSVSLAFLTAISGLLLFLSVRRSQSSLAARSRDSASPRIQQWQRLLHRMDRRLKRRGLVRAPSETLHQFARRVRVLADTLQTGAERTWPHVSADWYVAYANTRFRPSEAEPPSLPPKHIRRNLDS